MSTPKTHNVTVYKAADGWRWRMRARNGKIVAEGGEAYTRRGRCFEAAVKVVDAISAGGVTIASEHAKS